MNHVDNEERSRHNLDNIVIIESLIDLPSNLVFETNIFKLIVSSIVVLCYIGLFLARKFCTSQLLESKYIMEEGNAPAKTDIGSVDISIVENAAAEKPSAPVRHGTARRDFSVAELDFNLDLELQHEESHHGLTEPLEHQVKSIAGLLWERQRSVNVIEATAWISIAMVSAILIAVVLAFEKPITQATGLDAGLFVGSIGTVLACSIPIVLFSCIPRYRRHINIMLVSKSVADVLIALSFLLTPVWKTIGINHENDENSCKWLSFIRQYLIMVSQLWILCIALDLRSLVGCIIFFYCCSSWLTHPIDRRRILLAPPSAIDVCIKS